MTAQNIRSVIASMTTHITFDYHDKSCGVDPISANCYEIWCGDVSQNVRSLDKVMNIKIFDGMSLNEIGDKINLNETV